MRESQRTSPMNFQFPMVQARAASADGLSSRCGLVRESDGNSPFGKKRSNPAARRGGIGSACTFPARTYLESSVRLLWQNPISPGAVTRRQPFPVQNRSNSEACGPSTNQRLAENQRLADQICLPTGRAEERGQKHEARKPMDGTLSFPWPRRCCLRDRF
jgi:hypothetical protein